jgi:hypothetical protein
MPLTSRSKVEMVLSYGSQLFLFLFLMGLSFRV